jgi:cation diffusion facilitator family transporter
LSHSHSTSPLHTEHLDPHSNRYRETVKITVIGAVIDTFLGVVKIIIGLAAQSQALIADGIHSFSDLATDVIVLYAAKHSHQEADEEHPYGHARFETVATVALGVALIGVAIGISLNALMRLFEPEFLPTPGIWALIIAGFSVLAKEVIYQYTMRVANKYNSDMLRANAWHSRTDALSSIIVFVGIGGSMAGLWYLDAIAAVGVGVLVGKIGWDLAFSSLRELVDTGLEQERIDAIRSAILGVDGVKSLHILRTRRMAGEALVDVHIQVEPRISVSEGHFVSETVRSKIIKEIEEVTDVMVHIDPEDDEAVPSNTKLPMRTEVLRLLQGQWKHIEAAEKIINTRLHYLDGAVEVDITLPLSVLPGTVGTSPDVACNQLQTDFNEVADKLEFISVIRLQFS